jgi:hypothetical protein
MYIKQGDVNWIVWCRLILRPDGIFSGGIRGFEDGGLMWGHSQIWHDGTGWHWEQGLRSDQSGPDWKSIRNLALAPDLFCNAHCQSLNEQCAILIE